MTWIILGGLFMAVIGVFGKRVFQRIKIKHPVTTTTDTPAQETPDTTPDQFTFTDVNNVSLSAVQTSNTITVSGINTATAISVSGGEYQVNGGTWVSTTGTVEVDDTVAVRHTSSGSYLTPVNTTLTIGGVSDIFTSITLAPVGGTTGQSVGLLLAITRAS